LDRDRISAYLRTQKLGKKIYIYNSIGSTNEKAFEIADNEDEGAVIISEEQKNGRGSFGRSWESPKDKGIWMSVILKPDISTVEVPVITQVAAAAVVEALECRGFKAEVKWPNDIMVNNKKICGILTEMSVRGDKVSSVVLGIGVNVNVESEELSLEIRARASSLFIETNEIFDRNMLVAEILNYLEYFYYQYIKEDNLKLSLDICRNKSMILNKEIKFEQNGSIVKGEAIDLDSEGKLMVNIGGNIKSVVSGEISLLLP